MAKNVLEKTIVQHIKKYMDSLPHTYGWKNWGGSMTQAGLSDLVYCVRGRMFCIEVKAAGGKATELQKRFIDNMKF